MHGRWKRPNLANSLCVVAGATRGAGKAIAIELGACGATVVVTGRTTRANPRSDVPGTLEDTAEAVESAGGRAIPVACDHTDPAALDALVERVRQEGTRLDGLVVNAWGGNEVPLGMGIFWSQGPDAWEAMVERGVKAHWMTLRAFGPFLMAQSCGLVVHTTFADGDRYTGNLLYDLSKLAIRRMAFGAAKELEPLGPIVLAVTPGFMRTERVLAAHGTTEENWQNVPALAQTESPHYLGRGVASLVGGYRRALAGQGDPSFYTALRGKTVAVADLAQVCGFTDVDGRQPGPFRLPTLE